MMRRGQRKRELFSPSFPSVPGYLYLPGHHINLIKAPGKKHKTAWTHTYMFEFKQHFPGDLDAFLVDILNGCYVSLEKRYQRTLVSP